MEMPLKWWEIHPQLLLITDRKPHTAFLFLPKLMTFNSHCMLFVEIEINLTQSRIEIRTEFGKELKLGDQTASDSKHYKAV